jgi:hypothetical protein
MLQTEGFDGFLDVMRIELNRSKKIVFKLNKICNKDKCVNSSRTNGNNECISSS